MNEQPVKPKRRWLRFSLRTLFVLLTVACVLIGWKVNKANQQWKVVEWGEAMGGTAYYDYQFDSEGGFIVDAEPPGPAWLRCLAGIDFLAEASFVGLTMSQVSDLHAVGETNT